MESFFALEDTPKKKEARLRQLPPVPDTGWRPPTEYPNLSAVKLISFDTETKEEDFEHGPGWARNKSHIVGASIAAVDSLGNRGKWYFPIRHEVDTHENLDPGNTLRWFDHVLNTPSVDKIGANLTYDVANFKAEGVTVSGDLYDVQYAEALIDSDARVALDRLGQKYVGGGKTTEALYEWLAAAFGGNPTPKQRANLYRSPPRLAGPYAEDDADLPIDIMRAQIPVLLSEGLWPVFRLECDLIPMMIAMRFRGVRVDIPYAEKLRDELVVEIKSDYERILNEYGIAIDGTASSQLQPLLDRAGVKYATKWDTGNAIIDKEFLADLDHPLGEFLNDLREKEKTVGTFLESYVLKRNINGVIFPQFHQLKGDSGGTKVGRFASSDPNLQNIPSRTELGKRVRRAFIAHCGHLGWRKNDYSQIHYRILAHFAVDDGDGSAEALRQRYINDKKTDYHDDVFKAVAPFMGWDITDEKEAKRLRRPIKNVNFGLLYGQSLKALMRKVAMYFGESFSAAQGQAFFDAYFAGAPYVKPTMREIGEEVQRFGYVTTVLGRRIRFNEFEPFFTPKGKKPAPLPYEEALMTYGAPLKRAYEYRGVNYKFQGSEPDIMKTGMLKLWQSGVLDTTGVPVATVHDELGFSQIDDSPQQREAFAFIQNTMENAVKLRVPVFVDSGFADNWADAD
jgi:DNA polymerase I-like protein with 3'-5' exonuclease and polymerase domains